MGGEGVMYIRSRIYRTLIVCKFLVNESEYISFTYKKNYIYFVEDLYSGSVMYDVVKSSTKNFNEYINMLFLFIIFSNLINIKFAHSTVQPSKLSGILISNVIIIY